jgi:hypothetical protein
VSKFTAKLEITFSSDDLDAATEQVDAICDRLCEDIGVELADWQELYTSNAQE